MALAERTFPRMYSIRQLPFAGISSLQNARAFPPSCTKPSCCRLHRSLTSTAGEDEEAKAEAPSMPQEVHVGSHISPKRGRGMAKTPNVRKNTRSDHEDDDKFMREALCEAEEAAAIGEVPVGAVLVSQGRVVARAHNCVERENDPTAHAEMICIRSTARKLGSWRLLDSTLYVTLEPCPMCAGALLQARVGAVVWGARNHLLGADGSWVSLFPRHSLADYSEQQPLDSDNDGAAQGRRIHPFNPHIRVRGGVLSSDCSEIMKKFFRQRRKESKKAKTTGCFFLSKLISAIKRAFHVIVSFMKYLGLDYWILYLGKLHWKQRS